MRAIFILLLFIFLAKSDIYTSSLDGKNNKTRTNSAHFAVLWMNYTSITNIDFRLASSIQNMTLVVIDMPLNSSKGKIEVWKSSFGGIPGQKISFNITSEQEKQLSAGNWTLYVNTPSFPNGEISGKVRYVFIV